LNIEENWALVFWYPVNNKFGIPSSSFTINMVHKGSTYPIESLLKERRKYVFCSKPGTERRKSFSGGGFLHTPHDIYHRLLLYVLLV
jgi:hypothetical protein